jgi:hypothetical protein
MTHSTYVCVPPPIETLTEKLSGQSFWPEALVNRATFTAQIEQRRALLKDLQQVFSTLPLTLSLTDGLNQGLVTERAATELYESLSIVLRSDESQERLALYLPFELLSPTKDATPRLTKAATEFARAFTQAWEAQLTQHEVRANYVDGDVLEPELLIGDHPRVVKAAHMIPGLVAIGHMDTANAWKYYHNSEDSLLRQSIADSLYVASDLGLQHPDLLPSRADPDPTTIPTVGTTPGRLRWLEKVAKEAARRKDAELLARLLGAGTHVTESPHGISVLVALEAIRHASLLDASVYFRHRAWIEMIAQEHQTTAITDSLQTLHAYLHANAILDDHDLANMGIWIPQLAGPFYTNRQRLSPSTDKIMEMCTRITRHPQLSQWVYPIMLVYGSRVKGYGLSDADCDVAVFIKPNTDRSMRDYLEQTLQEIFDHQHLDGDIKMFWLAADGTTLKVIDWPDLCRSDGWSSWLYILFGALWFGDVEDIRVLHEQLLTPYFCAPDVEKDGKPIHTRWVEEIERDSLQYRLLHKGFERFYPIISPMNTLHGNLIDGSSAFYDTRYRRIATELFVRRVFLPQL